MAATADAVESDLVESIGKHVLGGVSLDESDGDDSEKFDFDDAFQTKIAALALRDPLFMERVDGLISPEYFENSAEATLVNIAQGYWDKYRRVPDMVTLTVLLKEAIGKKVIRRELVPEIRKAVITLKKTDIGDRDFVVDKVADFARFQAFGKALLESVELAERGRIEEGFERVKKSMEVGASETVGAYDYWERIEQRTQVRREMAAGIIKPRGVTTGIRKLDRLLKHHGWGRRELSVIMGGPKAGKSTALGDFATSASMAGYNVLVVTLEVSAEIIADRLDAKIAETAVNELGDHLNDVSDKITLAQKKAGKLIMHEYASGSLSPAMLRRLLSRYRAQGTKFDLVVVDYADIMAPNYRSNDSIQDSKSVYLELRAIAQDEDVALLTATQTNREGAKATVARMEHTAEDFNRVRIADILISINKTEEEKARNEARLYFAASRNQRGDFTVRIQQDVEKMIFVKRILGIE